MKRIGVTEGDASDWVRRRWTPKRSSPKKKKKKLPFKIALCHMLLYWICVVLYSKVSTMSKEKNSSTEWKVNRFHGCKEVLIKRIDWLAKRITLIIAQQWHQFGEWILHWLGYIFKDGTKSRKTVQLFFIIEITLFPCSRGGLNNEENNKYVCIPTWYHFVHCPQMY